MPLPRAYLKTLSTFSYSVSGAFSFGMVPLDVTISIRILLTAIVLLLICYLQKGHREESAFVSYWAQARQALCWLGHSIIGDLSIPSKGEEHIPHVRLSS